eukprot:403371584
MNLNQVNGTLIMSQKHNTSMMSSISIDNNNQSNLASGLNFNNQHYWGRQDSNPNMDSVFLHNNNYTKDVNNNTYSNYIQDNHQSNQVAFSQTQQQQTPTNFQLQSLINPKEQYQQQTQANLSFQTQNLQKYHLNNGSLNGIGNCESNNNTNNSNLQFNSSVVNFGLNQKQAGISLKQNFFKGKIGLSRPLNNQNGQQTSNNISSSKPIKFQYPKEKNKDNFDIPPPFQQLNQNGVMAQPSPRPQEVNVSRRFYASSQQPSQRLTSVNQMNASSMIESSIHLTNPTSYLNNSHVILTNNAQNHPTLNISNVNFLQQASKLQEQQNLLIQPQQYIIMNHLPESTLSHLNNSNHYLIGFQTPSQKSINHQNLIQGFQNGNGTSLNPKKFSGLTHNSPMMLKKAPNSLIDNQFMIFAGKQYRKISEQFEIKKEREISYQEPDEIQFDQSSVSIGKNDQSNIQDIKIEVPRLNTILQYKLPGKQPSPRFEDLKHFEMQASKYHQSQKIPEIFKIVKEERKKYSFDNLNQHIQDSCKQINGEQGPD